MDKPFFRSNIPLRSTLTVLVSGGEDDEEEAFTAQGTLGLPDTSEVSWTNRELKEGVSLELDDPGTYSGRIELTFVRKSTARLQMTVVKPDDSRFVYDPPPLTQSSGVDHTHILLVTKKK